VTLLTHRALANRRVLIAASRHTSDALAAGLRDLGAQVVLFPTIEIRPLEDTTAIDHAVETLDRYDWVIFTSGYGVRCFLARAVPDSSWQGRQVCAVGPATARALEQAGIPVSLIPAEFSADGIVAAFAARPGGLASLAGARILLPGAREARALLPSQLVAAGASVEVLPCYENVLPDVDAALLHDLEREPPDVLVFASSSSVTNFVRIVGEQLGRRLLVSSAVAAIGPVTAATVEGYGKKVEILPAQNTAAALLKAIAAYSTRTSV
jgi:uroporphyrinogen III methyltransferase/synthase